MINLPPKLTPSELLIHDGLSPFVDNLLCDCRLLRAEGRLLRAERRALDAVEVSRESGAQAAYGVAMVHLGDVHREMSKLGPALADCQKAYRIFQRRLSRYQRHNEAVAAYALGLVHQLLGNDMEAVGWYQRASKLFERVKDDWVAINALEQVEIGARTVRWMETLIEYLRDLPARAAEDLIAGIRVPIILSDTDGGSFAIADLEIEQYVIGRRLRIGGKTFQVQPVKGHQCVTLLPGAEYYARNITGPERSFVGAGEGDYALVMQATRADKEGPAVLETLEGPEFGTFEHDANGNIIFARPGAPPIVIGSGEIEDVRMGYITALLKGSGMRDDIAMQKEETSRQRALAAARRCETLLKERFGAQRVIPFGSVVSPEAWRPGSDLDLAVEGLPPEQFFRAWSSLREVLPPDLEVDLVALEDVYPEMRARILGEVDMPDDPVLALKKLIEDELAALRRVVEAVREGSSHLDTPPSQFDLNALASYVHQFYTGCERCLERIALRVDGQVPGGAFSHANLLAQMAHERPGVRPAVLNEELWLRLQDYLEFRHFFRHAYGYNLEWLRLAPLVEGMEEILADLQKQLAAFFDALLAKGS